jgi:hypothetical protein
MTNNFAIPFLSFLDESQNLKLPVVVGFTRALSLD